MSSGDVCKNTFRSSSYPDDLTSQYFRDISSIPLLSSEEEQELTQKLDRLRNAIRDQLLLSYSVKEEYLSVSGGSPEKRGSIIFDSALRNRLIALYIQNAPAEGIKPKEVEKLRSYDRALSEISSRLVESNVRLVISIARRYRNVGLELIDLIQEGNTALLRAVELFDPSLGYRFSTYATYWIKQGITRAIAEKSTMIRIPSKMLADFRKIQRASLRLEQNLQRPPTLDELMKETNFSAEKVRLSLNSNFEMLPFDALLRDQENVRLSDLVRSSDPNPEEQRNSVETQEMLRKALLLLSPREIALLRTRFGLDDGEFRTLAETGEIHDISRERARLIERSALRKLRQKRFSRVTNEALIASRGAR